jgi:chorismate mutase/prephenate dehydratase
MTDKKIDQQTHSGVSVDSIRKRIDHIDTSLLELINKRLEMSKQIGQLKKDQSIPIYSITRERELISRLCSQNKGPLKNDTLLHLFTDIVSASRDIQQPQRITYLGPEATFTHIAALNHFGRSAFFFPQPTIQDVFIEVEKGNADFGVVPVENSIEGSVNYTLDLFFESDLKICSEKYLTITQDLLSLSGSMNDIKVVYSHPQPIGQCRTWLRKHLPRVSIEECGSTSFAAKKAAGDPEAAAIASSEAGKLYGLKVVASKIEDHSKNTTRFLIIGRGTVHRTGDDKTSIMFSAPHIPGSLYKVLEPIAESGINMMKLESRPSKHENWNYFFFVDLEGHAEDIILDETIAKMKNLCLFLKSLGSYPKYKEQGQA